MRMWPLGLAVCVGCAAPVGMTMRSMIPVLEEMEAAVSETDDLEIVRRGLPSGMLLVEGLVRREPRNARVRLLAAKLYSGYALAFTEHDDPWAKSLYEKARDHGLAGLRYGSTLRAGTFAQAENAVLRLGKGDVPLLFWTAQAWASVIQMGLDDPRNQADLARVESMMERVLVLDEQFYYGGAHLFKGVLLGAKPPPAGGDPAAGIAAMERAFEISGGHSLLPLYFQASLQAAIPGMEDDARRTIRRILGDQGSHPCELNLTNAIAAFKAKSLLQMLQEEEE
ncbi:hypothetical protein JXA88_04285 [Candidatus Fermentibacteria bacterium]|nr:hypothetical protein [Candidatus Fermentibacteria bacterium]